MKVLVTGAGGFIGGHLVGALLDRGDDVRAVDVKRRQEWWQLHETDNMLLDLREYAACETAVAGVDQVYNLAADMGGIGYITEHKMDPMLSVLINTHLLRAGVRANVERHLFTSSACVYSEGFQAQAQATVALHESMAYPADPEDGYGWEKLFSERMCRHFQEETDLETRVARLHNVYGPMGSWNDGREKAPAAICRKVAEAVRDNFPQIEIWGDGKQTRSFMYVADCLTGLQKIMAGGAPEPVNLGTSELVDIDRLVSKVEKIAVKRLSRVYNTDAPQGVRGRNSDNALMRERYDWEPSIPLSEGLKPTYEWIAEQVNAPRERSDWAMPAWGRAGT